METNRLFVEYANLPVSNSPKHFYRFFEHQFLPLFPINSSETKEVINMMLVLIDEFSDFSDFKNANQYLEELIKEAPNDRMFFENAFEYVWASNIGVGNLCWEGCFLGVEKSVTVIDNPLESEKTLKCYICEQEYFRYILLRIIDGLEYSQINGFQAFINFYRHFIKSGVEIISTSEDKSFKESLKKTIYNESETIKLSIGETIRAAISYSLSDFLLNNDRRKLKKCPECGRFYTSKTVRKTYCSDKCRLAFHNRKNIKSGKAKEYKRRKRKEGAKMSYYG